MLIEWREVHSAFPSLSKSEYTALASCIENGIQTQLATNYFQGI
jgi:hypothetical protein